MTAKESDGVAYGLKMPKCKKPKTPTFFVRSLNAHTSPPRSRSTFFTHPTRTRGRGDRVQCGGSRFVAVSGRREAPHACSFSLSIGA